MWNDNAPLELLEEMPNKLSEDNLALIQQVIDRDKYKNSAELGYDLCGSYAPFCVGCDKSVKYPCAVSYVKMKIAEGMEISIIEEPEEEPVAQQPVPVEPVTETEVVAEHHGSGNKIRIAIARKRR